MPTLTLFPWLGNKVNIANQIIEYKEHRGLTLVIPFLGAGGLFIYYEPEEAILGDLNPLIVNVYERLTTEFGYNLFKETLEDVRKKFNSLSNEEDRGKMYSKIKMYINENKKFINCGNEKDSKKLTYLAIYFIFICKMSYYGKYQEGKNGLCTSKYNEREKNFISNLKDYQIVVDKYHNILKKNTIHLVYGSWRDTLKKALQIKNKHQLLSYLDPPYYKCETSDYTDYTKKPFGFEEHRKLASFLKDNELKFIMSNSNHKNIKEMYYYANSIDEIKVQKRKEFIIKKLEYSSSDNKKENCKHSNHQNVRQYTQKTLSPWKKKINKYYA